MCAFGIANETWLNFIGLDPVWFGDAKQAYLWVFTPYIIYHFLCFCRNTKPKQKSNSKNIADKANLLNEWSEQVISEHYRSIGSCNVAVRGM